MVITDGNVREVAMKKMSKEQIINTALELMRSEQDYKNINLREIARTLGCAHTNIYNYFQSSTDLLWAAHTALQEIFMKTLRNNLSASTDSKRRLNIFFETFISFYMDNIGWFRLAWMVYIGDKRPESDITANQKAREELDKYIIDIWKNLSETYADHKKVSDSVHNVHCYIIGEISNYISGRRIIENEEEFKSYVVYNAIRFLTLSLKEE